MQVHDIGGFIMQKSAFLQSLYELQQNTFQAII